MGIFTGIILYAMVWWIVLQGILPFGVKTPDAPEPGMAASAPVNPQMGRKIIATTLVSAVVWVAIYLTIEYSGFSFREWAKTM